MPKIAIIDDNDLFREALVEYLGDSGYEVEQADNGKSGLDLLKTFRFDCIILDVFMPEADGLEVLKEIKSMQQKPHIITISGGGVAQQQKGMFLHLTQKLGAHISLEKPVRFTKIKQAIESVLYH